jgi:soluble lytic murein transglycosylase-like protein
MKGLIKALSIALLSAALISLAPNKEAPAQLNNSTQPTSSSVIPDNSEPETQRTRAPIQQDKRDEKVAVKTETELKPESTARQVKPAVPSNTQGCEQYRHLFEQYAWPVNTALAICQAESSGNIQAVNWGDNHGKCKGSFSLMQVGCFWYPHFGYSEADRYKPEVNVKIAYQIYERQKSFGAWTTYTGGRYLKFL